MKLNEVYGLVEESFGSKYQWNTRRKGSSSEDYEFDVGEIEFYVEVSAFNTKLNYPLVSFYSSMMGDADDLFAATGNFSKMGVTPIKVFSTVIDIISKSDLVRNAGGFIMDAKSSEPSRVRLYERMLKRFGNQFRKTSKSVYVRFEVLL